MEVSEWWVGEGEVGAGEGQASSISPADIQGVSMREGTVQLRGAVIRISPETLLRFMPGFQAGTVAFEEAACFHSRDFFMQHHTALPAANKQVKLNSITPKKLRDLCKQRYHFFYERSNQSKVPWKFLSVVYAEYAGTPVDWADAMCKRILHALDGLLSGKLRKLHNEKLILAYLSSMAKHHCKLDDSICAGIAHFLPDDLLDLGDLDCFFTLDDNSSSLRPSPDAFSFGLDPAGASDAHFFLA